MIGPHPDMAANSSGTGKSPDGSDDTLIDELRQHARNAETEHDWLDVVFRRVSEYIGAPSLRLWSLSPDGGRLQLEAVVGLDVPFDALQDHVPTNHSELGRVVTSGTPYVVDCADSSCPHEVRQWANHQGVRSFFALPVRVAGRIRGVLGGFTRHPLLKHQQDWLSKVATLIGQGIAAAEVDSEESRTADLLSSLIPCLSSAIVTLDRSGNVTRWSANAERLFGWSEREVLHKPLPIVCTDRQHEFATLASADGASSRINHSRTVCQRADLRPVPVERTTGPLFDPEGNAIGRVEVFADDSQRVQLSRCLQVQGQVAKILVGCRGVDDGLPLLLAALGEWLGCDAAEYWMRAHEQDVLSRTAVWAKTTATRDRLAATHVQLKVNANDWPARAHRGDQIVYVPDLTGSTCRPDASRPKSFRQPVAGIAIPIHREGRRLGVVILKGESLDDPDELTRQTLRFSADALAQLLTRLQTQAALAEAEANLRQSQKMDAIGLLAGGVAHDFNNLLTIVLAYSEMGLEEVDEGHPLRELFAEIHGAGQRAAKMTRQLLAVSRQQPTRPVTCNLNHVVEEMDRMLGRLLGPQITLIHDTEEGLANIHADVNQIEQVLLNLVVNARDAMPEGGTITVATRNVVKSAGARSLDGRRRGTFAVLAVTDTGCGMDEATRSRIFEPFFTTKDVGQGTGMGLSTVFGIVKQSGGFIEVESAVNAGSTFSIYLPQVDAALATRIVDDQPDRSPDGTESVLVVEHDDAVRALIRRLLEVRGYTVFEAADGGEALEIVNADGPAIDLVLTEVHIPVVDGVTLVRRMKCQHRGPKILMMSGNTDPPTDLELDLSRQFLHKPFTSGELATKVRLAIDCDQRIRV